jgi:elongation factor Ts
MKCKEAIEKFEGDFNSAKQFLFEKNLATAEKKSAREANCGMISFTCEPFAFVGYSELFCETDFVLKNESFLDFGEKVGSVFGNFSESVSMDFEQCQEYLREQNKDLWDENQQLIAKIQENIKVNSITVDRLQGDCGQIIGTYMHTPLRPNLGKSLTYVVLSFSKDSALTEKEQKILASVSEELAVHVFCMKPEYIKEQDIPVEEMKKIENEIQESLGETMKKKPEHIIEKMVQGKKGKILNHRLLMKQEMGDSDEGTDVEMFLGEVSKVLGFSLQVDRFHTVKI